MKNRELDFDHTLVSVSITPLSAKEDRSMKRREFLKKAGVGAAAAVTATAVKHRR